MLRPLSRMVKQYQPGETAADRGTAVFLRRYPRRLRRNAGDELQEPAVPLRKLLLSDLFSGRGEPTRLSSSGLAFFI